METDGATAAAADSLAGAEASTTFPLLRVWLSLWWEWAAAAATF
jgi:hypothetical protein